MAKKWHVIKYRDAYGLAFDHTPDALFTGTRDEAIGMLGFILWKPNEPELIALKKLLKAEALPYTVTFSRHDDVYEFRRDNALQFCYPANKKTTPEEWFDELKSFWFS